MRAQFGDAVVQLFGMWGSMHTYRRTLPWMLHLLRGKIERCEAAPASRVPMRSAVGDEAAHAIPGTPMSASGENHPAILPILGQDAASGCDDGAGSCSSDPSRRLDRAA
jgi:hypothetical protein